MGKIRLTFVLFIAIIGTTLVTDLKKENVSKLWSNLLIMLLSLISISNMFIIIAVIITCAKKIMVIMEYKYKGFVNCLQVNATYHFKVKHF